MNIYIGNDCHGRNWEEVAELLKHFGLSNASADDHRQAFENSYAVSFVYDGNEMIGIGRAISDGIFQAAIYNIAVTPRYHGLGIGRIIIEDLLGFVRHCNVILFTHPDKLEFYKHLGFRKMRTGLALYANEAKVEEMGFIE
ncbi:GNAT family N-acetyltransferase [Paenibacillus donghaensis]|uniref:GNAT family N-acetyltransferase n=1 Tax=Paenibacillus donghaensis TaxID=414771 RepID=A0A2Z2KGX1_9BACL|nr:GNAT family N-acetyltransferase [Paenibacillus donghaensis]ASA23305.1 GNAT family N-acetyltransferase [Paenibacillus donghaensis]